MHRLSLGRKPGSNGKRPAVLDPPPGTNSSTATIPQNHLSTTEYAARCKLILELSADLHDLDTDLDLKLDFPRLVVIGDQSSGKSSLVEAVSGINVPRDSGTCTRCPMECIMRSTTTESQWSCCISLQFTEFNDEGRRTVPFGDMIYDRSSVDLWIRRAQAAILSPHRPHTDFLNKSQTELKEVDPQRMQFSNNSVRVEVRDPKSPDLNFVDLPGIIHAGDPSLTDEVIDLVTYAIRPENTNTVILIAMPMTSDWQNHLAVRLAKDADPNGDRTIGILTKPDVLQDGDIGSRESWRKILADEDPDLKTKHGYYCVRLPNDLERRGSNTKDRALMIEQEFFSTRAPWNLMPAKDKSRCGIPNFIKNISALLVELIEEYLPMLEKAVYRLLDDCLKEIAKLPPLLDKAPSTEIHLRISAFCQDFKDAVFGRTHRDFVQGNTQRYSHFSQDIFSTQPKYVKTGGTGGLCLDLEDVRAVKEGTITWELPPHVPFDATVTLVEMYTSQWENPSLQCFDDIVTNSINLEDTLLRAHFGQYGELMNFVRKLTSEERDRCRADARNILQKILQFESRPIFTQNLEFLRSERYKWLKAHAPYWMDDETYNRHRYRLLDEKYYQEYELMADSYAYFQVSHKRIIDYVPLTIEHELNQKFVKNLQTLLFSNVTREGANPGRLEELIREGPALGKLRRTLETRRKALLKIKQKLDAFWLLRNVTPPRPDHHRNDPGSSARPGSSASDYHSVNGSAE